MNSSLLAVFPAPLFTKFQPLPLIKEENDEVHSVHVDFCRLNSIKGIEDKQKKKRERERRNERKKLIIYSHIVIDLIFSFHLNYELSLC